MVFCKKYKLKAYKPLPSIPSRIEVKTVMPVSRIKNETIQGNRNVCHDVGPVSYIKGFANPFPEAIDLAIFITSLVYTGADELTNRM